MGVVAVPDERLGLLADMYHSAKVTPAVIEFVDIAGLVKGASKGCLLYTSGSDGFYHVYGESDADAGLRPGGGEQHCERSEGKVYRNEDYGILLI